MSYSKLFSLPPLVCALVMSCLLAPTLMIAVQSTALEGAEAKPSQPVPVKKVIRIKAGATDTFQDELGVKWLSDEGFVDGETTERPGLQITNTKTPSLYLAERFSMTAFSKKIPDGKYVVKLHFAETYEGIDGAGQRVFTFSVEGQEFKNFDVWAKAGGALRAYVESVPVTIADGKLDITFTSQVENPEINALEIIPVD